MSWIRSLGNPDGAYIWDDCDGYVYISTNETTKQHLCIAITPREFYGLISCFIRYRNREGWKYKNFSMKESDNFHYYIFNYKGYEFKLWQVTWWYVVNRVKESKQRLLKKKK